MKHQKCFLIKLLKFEKDPRILFFENQKLIVRPSRIKFTIQIEVKLYMAIVRQVLGMIENSYKNLPCGLP